MADIITIIKNSPAIAEGYIRTIFNIRTSIMVYREENYCKKCPLSHKNGSYTGVCDSKLGGCGCGISAKTSQNTEPCPKGFWSCDWFKPDLFEEFIKKNPIK